VDTETRLGPLVVRPPRLTSLPTGSLTEPRAARIAPDSDHTFLYPGAVIGWSAFTARNQLGPNAVAATRTA
jgi:hypothetical protein